MPRSEVKEKTEKALFLAWPLMDKKLKKNQNNRKKRENKIVRMLVLGRPGRGKKSVAPPSPHHVRTSSLWPPPRVTCPHLPLIVTPGSFPFCLL
jgi:hypothetical protein